MKRLLITACLPMTVRNLRIGALRSIAQHFEVILLTPFAGDARFQEEMREWNIQCEVLPISDQWSARLGSALASAASRGRRLKEYEIDTDYVVGEFLKRTDWKRSVVRRVAECLNVNQWIEGLGERLARNAWRSNTACHQLLDKYRPDAVFSTHPYLRVDWPLLFNAQQRGIPLIALIHSWDNSSSRGPLPFPFRTVLTWSTHMQNEVRRYNPGLASSEIAVVGAPQHDIFCEQKSIVSRAEFFARHNLDPNRELITFAGCGIQTPNEHKPLGALIKAIEGDALSKPAQAWARFYGDDHHQSSLPLVENRRHVHWEKATAEFWGGFRVERSWREGTGFDHYLNLLAHSSVVVCGPSTVSIDAAMLDRPIVNYCYDGETNLSFPVSIRRHYFQTTHYQRVTCSGGVRLAFDDEELCGHVNDYLDDPTQDRAARLRLVHAICGPFDGRASERILQALLTSFPREKMAA